jgi:hypothetical protein
MSACSIVQSIDTPTLPALHSSNASVENGYCIGDTRLSPSTVATPDRGARFVISSGDAQIVLRARVGWTALSQSIFFDINRN